MKSSGDGGYKREEYGKAVTKKGPQSTRSPSDPREAGGNRTFADAPTAHTFTDSELDRAAGYRGVSVKKNMTK